MSKPTLQDDIKLALQLSCYNEVARRLARTLEIIVTRECGDDCDCTSPIMCWACDLRTEVEATYREAVKEQESTQ